MTHEELKQQLEALDMPNIALPKHEQALKNVLLDSGYFGKKKMSIFKRLAPIGGLLALAVLAFLVSQTYRAPGSASAQEIADKSAAAVTQLSSKEKQALDEHLKSGAENLLTEAQNARDLSEVPKDQIDGLLYPPAWMDNLSETEQQNFKSRLDALNLTTAKFLQFTDSNGQKVILAIDDNNLPVYKVPDFGQVADDETKVKFLVENFGSMLKNVSLLSPTAASDIETSYKDYVASELIAKWQADPVHALGRLTSSPWPDSIIITGIAQTSADSYEVTGKVLEVTSSEITSLAANATPITLTVQNQNGSWKITRVK